MKAIVKYDNDPKEYEIDIPSQTKDGPNEIQVECECPNCHETHLAIYRRTGVRLHDDGNIPVYHFNGVTE